MGKINFALPNVNIPPPANEFDPTWFESRLVEESKLGYFLEMVDSLLIRKPKNIEEESENEIRLKMDGMILKPFGFSKNDVRNLYKDLLNLVKVREVRARSVKKDK